MSRKRLGLLILLALLTTGCDPGMKIRQRMTNSASTPSQNPSPNDLDIRVAEQHQLISETWYSPEITLVNKSQMPISIIRIELATPEHVYEPQDIGQNKIGQAIESSRSITQTLFYNLNKPVSEVFRQGAELKVHYKENEQERMQSLQLEGVGLNE
jgi:hypothetical protein